MPRILILITLAEVGGAQTYVAQLLPALAERYDVVVAAHGPGPLRDATRDAGARFVAAPPRAARSAPGAATSLGLLELVALMRRDAARPRARQQLQGGGARAPGGRARRRAACAIFTVHGWAFKAYHGRGARALSLGRPR